MCNAMQKMDAPNHLSMTPQTKCSSVLHTNLKALTHTYDAPVEFRTTQPTSADTNGTPISMIYYKM